MYRDLNQGAASMELSKMAARGSQSTAFADLNEVLVKSHIFFPVKSADTEVFPCIHVLCSSCLEMISSRSGQKSGVKMVCRVCKLEFEIPSRKVLRERKETRELVAELSKAANDCKWCQSCFEIGQYRPTWSELDGQSASILCTVCTSYKCLKCAEYPCNYQGHETIVMGSHSTEKPINNVKYEWHKKRLDVFCLACGKSGCFLCLVDNIPKEMKNDFEKQIGLNIELQSLIALSNELSDWKSEVNIQKRQYELSVMKIRNQIEEKTRANRTKTELLLNRLRLIEYKEKERCELTDALSKDANNYVSSCKFIQSSRDLGQKFCALGATLKKITELKRGLDLSIKPKLLPTAPFEWSDLEKWLETSSQGEGQFHKSPEPPTFVHNARLHGTRYQQGLGNFGNTCYFNAVIQCLCQSYLLKELYLVNTSKEPLTEAFVQFLNYRCAGEHNQDAAFYKFFEQLFTSSPKFNNFQQHDSHDLFIHFLNDLRSEERLHITGSSQSSVDPRKVLTAVDKVFGGHFITMYSCLECDQPYFVCECLLDISLPICIPKEQKQQQPFRGEGIRGTHQNHSGQQNHGSTVEEHQQHSQTFYNDQRRELAQGLLTALNEEQRIQEVEAGRFRERPVALTECLRFYTETEYIPEGYLCLSCQDVNQSAAAANASTMPAAMKRTLIYNPPAILVLHLKRFERTTTGFKKRSDKVSYEELLDLGPYCSSDCQRIDPEDKNVWYSLYGVVVHSGSLDFGHYIAYVKNGESNADSVKEFLQENFLNRDEVASAQRKKSVSGTKTGERKLMWHPRETTHGGWTYMSDSFTKPSTSDEALNQEAFMLFYERVPK